jgi:DNA topoisomerase-1
MESSVAVISHKWRTLQHNGVAFPPFYIPKGLSIYIKDEKVILSPDQEELVYAWAKKKDTHYVKDQVFQVNFLSDFKKLLPEKYQQIGSIEEINFEEAFTLVDKEKRFKEQEIERVRNLSRDDRKRISLEKKAERERLKSIFGKAIVDGAEVDIANWLVEPPGIFMGRGQHPLRGRWKPRIRPEDVILNLGEDAPVPEGSWKKVVHDHASTWLATWTEVLTDKRKYVWLHDSSTLRQNNDREKYDKADRLGDHINKIQDEIIRRMISSRDLSHRKLATVCYLISKLAMRVGDEKDPEEADTVGASTLRVEHIRFPESDGQQFIEFNFLGKDSVPWQKTLEVKSRDMHGLYDNLKLFMNGKQKGDQIFDGITSNKVNSFLRTLDSKSVPGLTAKVFRTYITTTTVREALANSIQVNKQSSEPQKIYIAKMANLKAAITCNHKKGIDPNNPASKKALERFEISIKSKEDTIRKLKDDIAAKKWKTDLQKNRLEARLEKVQVQLKLQKETRDYNLGTSLRNYIDPRVMRAWLEYVQLDWKKIYTATLQRKFMWVDTYAKSELRRFYPGKDYGKKGIQVVQEES